MRICHLGKYYPPARGGIETYTQTIARRHAAEGNSVRVVCSDHEPGWTSDAVLRDGDVTIHRLGRIRHAAKLDLCPRVIATVRAAADWADVLHLHAPNPLMYFALAAVRPQKPLVISHHADVVTQGFRSLLLAPWERWVYNQARAIILATPVYAEGSRILKRDHANRSERLHVIPYGIDLEPFRNPTPAALAAAAELRVRYGPAPIWLGCGRMTSYKGFPIALEALRHCPGTLIIVGDGPLRPFLEAKARELGVSDRTAIVGTIPDVVPYYLAAAALWFTSTTRAEAFGIAQIEAMAAGCPVINTAIPQSGVGWVSPDNLTGLTVPVGDAEALAAAAQRLMHDPALRSRFARNGRIRARDVFDETRMAADCLALYDRVIGAVPAVPVPVPVPANAVAGVTESGDDPRTRYLDNAPIAVRTWDAVNTINPINAAPSGVSEPLSVISPSISGIFPTDHESPGETVSAANASRVGETGLADLPIRAGAGANAGAGMALETTAAATT